MMNMKSTGVYLFIYFSKLALGPESWLSFYSQMQDQKLKPFWQL